MNEKKQVGIEELRGAVRLFDWCNESFNWSERDPFTAEQLLAIYRAYRASGWDIFPDRWAWRQVEEALRGIPPQWDKDEQPIYELANF